MRLTKEKAVELSIELWTWLAETGKMKCEWPGWGKYTDIVCHCFLCEYAAKHGGCSSCPYSQKFGVCSGGHYSKWTLSRTTRTSRKYARLFLEQLKQL